MEGRFLPVEGRILPVEGRILILPIVLCLLVVLNCGPPSAGPTISVEKLDEVDS